MDAKVKKASKKLAVVMHSSGLRVKTDGHFVVTSKDDALRAVQYAGTVLEKIDKIKRDSLSELETTYQLLREDLRDYQVKNELAEIVSNDYRSDLVERSGNMWVLDENTEVPESLGLAKNKYKSLKEIALEKSGGNTKAFSKLWNKVTNRVVDPSGIDEAVKEGLVTLEEIGQAYLDFVQTRYVMIKEKK